MAVKGANVIIRRLRTMRRKVPKAGVRQLDANALDLLIRATALTPFLTGVLEISGKIVRAQTAKSTARAVSFETAPFSPRGAEYALIMHEDTYELGPKSRSKPSTEDGPVGRKYLERPYRNQQKKYLLLMKGAYEEALQNSVRG